MGNIQQRDLNRIFLAPSRPKLHGDWRYADSPGPRWSLESEILLVAHGGRYDPCGQLSRLRRLWTGEWFRHVNHVLSS
jgi:hypothetical protein